MSPELAAQTFVPVELLELKPAPMRPALAPSSAPVAKIAATPARASRKSGRRGAMEVSLPNGARLPVLATVTMKHLPD
ncbi:MULTISPECIES: hypothetical protein [Methylosinus]|uniref:Uncharacterized protein n=1 Tax=Methylosinus trichosporium (strain ATCC 35070 / NCIMB 11131 / UNIQEM 75 / OB3b) TaxID=595536 RepID=A0A2D2D1Y7_METT3|nr:MULTISPECIES: hypothetical protein [Methylosinus]ATQ68998.1 hypothetical protein CQW49_14765 [Methylosinus trichosporium OB3b]